MRLEDVKKVCVLGAGQMGRQIALNTAMYGYKVYLTKSSNATLEKASAWEKEYLQDRVAKDRITAEKAEEIKSNLIITENIEEALREADIVIEAIVEDRKVKEELFDYVNKIVRNDTIIATNSSYMVSSLFTEFVDNPSRLVNLHYFNPALVMKLTEVVQGPHTSMETVDLLMQFSKKTGKSPVWVKKEIDGFLANRILRAISMEAFYLLENDIASFEDIDTAVEKGLNHPMGPFRLQDLTGIDLAYHTMERTLDETGVKRPGYDIIKDKYAKGEYGRKAGKGWYDYNKK